MKLFLTVTPNLIQRWRVRKKTRSKHSLYREVVGLVRCKQLLDTDLDAIIHENVLNFPESIMFDKLRCLFWIHAFTLFILERTAICTLFDQSWLGKKYAPAGVLQLDPREVYDFPIARSRKYVLLTRRGITLSHPLEEISAKLSKHTGVQECKSSWDDLLLPLTVNHTCTASLQTRALLRSESPAVRNTYLLCEC